MHSRLDPASGTVINRDDHRADTDCQLWLGNDVPSAGHAVYMLVWLDDDAPDDYSRHLAALISPVNAYLAFTPDGVVKVKNAPNGRAVVTYGDRRHEFKYASSISRGEVRIYRNRVVVPCACTGTLTDLTVW